MKQPQHLLLGGRGQQVVLGVRQARHHALHPVLAAPEQHREEVDAEHTRQLGGAPHLVGESLSDSQKMKEFCRLNCLLLPDFY